MNARCRSRTGESVCIAFAPVLECFLVCPGELADDQVIHFTGYDVKNILTYHGIPLDQHVFYSGTLPEYKMLFRKIIRELQQCKYGYEDYIASMFNTILLLVSRQQQEGENVEINIPEEIEAAVATPKSAWRTMRNRCTSVQTGSSATLSSI